MKIFLEPEYLLSCLLFVEENVNKKDYISLEKVNKFCNSTQEKLNQLHIESNFICSYDNIIDTVNIYPNYFIYDKEKNIISLNKDKGMEDLKNRFIASLLYPLLIVYLDFLKEEPTLVTQTKYL